jgi:ubiquitin carboxyl-terminal hydrolase 31
MRDTDPLYCIELPQLKEASEESGAYVLLCWVNVLQMEDHCARFGSPYTMQVGRETSYEDLQKLILKEMSSILHDDILVNSQEVYLLSELITKQIINILTVSGIELLSNML